VLDDSIRIERKFHTCIFQRGRDNGEGETVSGRDGEAVFQAKNLNLNENFHLGRGCASERERRRDSLSNKKFELEWKFSFGKGLCFERESGEGETERQSFKQKIWTWMKIFIWEEAMKLHQQREQERKAAKAALLTFLNVEYDMMLYVM
jgi:hypothetical protein